MARTLIVSAPGLTLAGGPDTEVTGGAPSTSVLTDTSGAVAPPAPLVEDEPMWIDYNELFENADTAAQRRDVWAAEGNEEAHVFGSGVARHRTYFNRAVPDAWQGRSIRLYGMFSHRKAGLTGTGSPPDDSIKLEIGYAVTQAPVARPALGLFNDGTAPNEVDMQPQLGVIQEAPIFLLLATIVVGVADRWIHCRVTLDGPESGGNYFIYNQGLLLDPIPL